MTRSLLAAAAVVLVTTVTPAVAVECGDADFSGKITAADALQILQTSVDLRLCDPCACDYSGSGTTGVEDALAVLRKSISPGATTPGACPACTDPVCGDGKLAAYRGRPFGLVDLDECEALDYDEPSVDVVRALDAKFHDITDKVEIHVDEEGCICYGFDVARIADKKRAVKAARLARIAEAAELPTDAATPPQTNIVTTSTVASTSLYCGDCLFSIWADSPVPIAVLEVDASGALCWLHANEPLVTEYADFGDYIRVHPNVSEECDDGNTEDEDGCSHDCRLE